MAKPIKRKIPPKIAQRGRPAGSKNKPRERVSRPDDARYLTIPEFCELFAVSRMTFYRHMPHLRVLKFGRRTLIPREEAERYAATLIVEPQQAA